MIWDAKSGQHKEVVDVFGNIIPHVSAFNDETNEVTIYLQNAKLNFVCEMDGDAKRKGKAITFVLEGASIRDKVKDK